MIARVANGAVTMAKARQPAFIVEVPRFEIGRAHV